MRYLKFGAVLLTFALLVFNGACPGGVQAKDLKIGFIYVGPIGDAGWTHAHDEARKAISGIPGVTTSYIDNVNDRAFTNSSLRNLAEAGNNVIFATSFNHMDDTIEVAKDFPNTIFMHCSGYMRSKNVGTYFARQYQAFYLAGIAAGAVTKTNTLGFVAAHPIAEVIRSINAFAMGAQTVNPDVKVHVEWVKNWFDPPKEKEMANKLIDMGADVVAQEQDTPSTQIVAQKRGVYSVGCYNDMRRYAPKANLTSSVWNWEVIYRHLLKQIQDEKWTSEDIWWGIDKAAVDISPLGPMVPEKTKKIVAEKREGIIKGKFRVYDGPVYDQNGKVRIPKGKTATDKELLEMQWFVKGVEGKI